MSKKNLIVGQSGGPTAVINSSLYGVVSEGLRHPEQIQHIYGMVNGIEGFLAGTVFPEAALKNLKLLQVPTSAPAAISFLNLWKIRFTPDFFKNSEK